MIRFEREGIHWLQFELLVQFSRLQHAIFLRHGGTSLGPYASLNLAYGRGDDAYCVEQNLSRAQALLRIERLSSLQKVHGNKVVAVSRCSSQELPCADGQMTSKIGLGLKIVHADCQAAIFYDPIKHVAAAVHCGWRGQIGNIYAQTVKAMSTNFGSIPSDIHVGIGPSLSPQHAEFVNYQEEFPKAFWRFKLEKNHFDLWLIAEWQLLEAGILPHHLQIARICTYKSEKDCFSFRRQKSVTGAHASMVMLLS